MFRGFIWDQKLYTAIVTAMMLHYIIDRWHTMTKEASKRWTALKDQVDQAKLDDADIVFKAFANSFEKSSSHWQARDEYLSDIKQSKHQTMAKLDIYIKDLIRRCQFPKDK